MWFERRCSEKNGERFGHVEQMNERRLKRYIEPTWKARSQRMF